ncbi:MAG: dTDP-4-dehydrorhamnose reductase [Bacteroidales bacterium]|nr:dTDP-4-dehydrorhamnose reductase [Bacteroidales bacterium]
MEKKTILVTGANGQLGNELRLLGPRYPQFKFDFIDIQELDLCQPRAVSDYFETLRPDYLINCAAYTAVDKAESDVALCWRVNRDAVEHLAKSASICGCRCLHVSTDYVFDGKGLGRPYLETDPTGPVSVYGQSKLAGEEALLKYCPDAVILRTAWLYSPFGNNFVKTMLRLGKAGSALRVVNDQLGTPTYAADLAVALMTVILSAEEGKYAPGIYHFTDEGSCTWYEFTREIHCQAGLSVQVTPVTTAEYPTAAVRPAYSILDKTKIKMTYGLTIPDWKDSLSQCLKRIDY